MPNGCHLFFTISVDICPCKRIKLTLMIDLKTCLPRIQMFGTKHLKNKKYFIIQFKLTMHIKFTH